MHMHWTLKSSKALLYTAISRVIPSRRNSPSFDVICGTRHNTRAFLRIQGSGASLERGKRPLSSHCSLLYVLEIWVCDLVRNRDRVANFIVTVTVLLHVYLLAASFYYTIFSLPPSIFTAQTCCLKMAPWPWNV